MEGVCVLHDKLARAHDPKAGSDLVPELGLYLVEINRQLAVTLYFAARDVRDHLFVGRTKTKGVVVAVLYLKHLWAKHLPAPGLLPELCRLYGGHQ